MHCILACMHTHICMHTHTHTCMHTLTHTNINTYTHMHTHTHTHTCMHSPTHTNINTHTHTSTHTHKLIYCVRKHIHTDIVHAYTHSMKQCGRHVSRWEWSSESLLLGCWFCPQNNLLGSARLTSTRFASLDSSLGNASVSSFSMDDGIWVEEDEEHQVIRWEKKEEKKMVEIVSWFHVWGSWDRSGWGSFDGMRFFRELEVLSVAWGAVKSMGFFQWHEVLSVA